MKNVLFILTILTLAPHVAWGQQDGSLKIIESTVLLSPPTLNESEFKKEWQEAESIRELDGGKHLSQRQKELLNWSDDWSYYDKRNLWDVSTWGDSWRNNCASVDSIVASSSLQPVNGIDYKAENAFDESLRTAWVEGADGYGIGESITWYFSQITIAITAVTVYNGYARSDNAWHDNSRVRQFKLYINGQPYALLNLKDTYRLQHFYIGEHRGSGAVLKFEITEVYEGDRYDDVAISDIGFDGTGCLCFAKGTMISTPDGETPIERLKTGDTILSLNSQTNEIEEATIAGLANRAHNLYEVDFGDVQIKTTADHPFYFEGNYYSIEKNTTYDIETKPLVVGQSINYLADNRIAKVVLKSIRKIDRYETTYTITELDRNRLFFANGLCVSTEKTYK